MHRIVVVTPAGRRKYLEILKKYILSDCNITEWQLWDNCRNPDDRNYLQYLEREHEKVKVFQIKGSNGTNSAIN